MTKQLSLQGHMPGLFGVGVPVISKHLKNIFESAELQEEVVVSILETTQATQFRIWATQIIKEGIIGTSSASVEEAKRVQ